MDDQLNQEPVGFEGINDGALNAADIFAFPDNTINHVEPQGPLDFQIHIAEGNEELAPLGGLVNDPQQINADAPERNFQELLAPAERIHQRPPVLIVPGQAPQRPVAAVRDQQLPQAVDLRERPAIQNNQAVEIEEAARPPAVVPEQRPVIQQEVPARTPGARLRDLLRRTCVGQSVLLHDHLTSQARYRLAQIIAEHLLETDENCPQRGQFQFWANEISAVFRFEAALSWYSPYQGGQIRRLATGRIYHRYNALRRQVAGVLDHNRRRRRMIQPELAHIDYDLLNQLHSVSLDDSWRIRELWGLTFAIRDRRASIQQYHENFPQLRTPIAPDLFQIDYDRLQLPNSDALLRKWPRVSIQLLEVARSRASCRTLLRNAVNVPDAIKALIVLPYLFKPRQLPGANGWRPSTYEQAKGFFQHVNAMHQMDTAIEVYETEMADHHLTCQPLVMVVGSFEDIDSAYLIVNREKYAFDEVLDAIDACFKAYFALDARYPTECEQAWVFLERYVYEIPRPRSARNFVSVSTLISYLTALNAVDEP